MENTKTIEQTKNIYPEVTKRVFQIPKYLEYPEGESPSLFSFQCGYSKEFQAKLDEYYKWAVVDVECTDETVNTVVETDRYREKITIVDLFASYDNGPWQYAYSAKRKERETKYLAVGGPKDGQYILSDIDRTNREYIAYNCSENGRGRGGKKYPTRVFVYLPLLPIKLQVTHKERK